jgi:hypothetical protein
LSATGQLGMAVTGQIQLTVVSRHWASWRVLASVSVAQGSAGLPHDALRGAHRPSDRHGFDVGQHERAGQLGGTLIFSQPSWQSAQTVTSADRSTSTSHASSRKRHLLRHRSRDSTGARLATGQVSVATRRNPRIP